MQSPVVLILFAVVNIVYVSSIQHNDHSNVYDIRKINKVEKHGFVTKNNTPAEFLPWREEFEGFDALEKISSTVSHQDGIFVCFIPPYIPLLYNNTRSIRVYIFLIFALKHRLRLFVRTSSMCTVKITLKSYNLIISVV